MSTILRCEAVAEKAGKEERDVGDVAQVVALRTALGGQGAGEPKAERLLRVHLLESRCGRHERGQQVHDVEDV